MACQHSITESLARIERAIRLATEAYADHHGVSVDEVTVDRTFEGDSNKVVGFRLSLDTDGRSRGCDERFVL